ADRRNADAALQVKDMILLRVRDAAHHVEHLCGDDLCFPAREVLQQHDELVAAEAGDDVVAAYGPANLPRSGLQQLVAGGMAAGVVDILELVEIDEEQRAVALPGGTRLDLRLELRDEAMAVEQAGQRIVIG